MFATIRKYEGVGNIDVIALAAKEQFFPLFEKLPGFVSYTLVDTGDNSVMSVIIFETRDQAEAANTAVRELVQQISAASCQIRQPLSSARSWPTSINGRDRRRGARRGSSGGARPDTASADTANDRGIAGGSR